MKNYLSATDLKNKASEILNQVYFKKDTVIINRYGKPIVKIVAIEKDGIDEEKIKSSLRGSFGSLPDFPDVTKNRKSRRKTLSL